MDKRVVRIALVGSPVTYALALLLFLMPFLSASCDAPEGYGRTTTGGTTSYTGLDLALGTEPTVDDDHLRPVSEQAGDDLGMQPVMLAAAIGVVVALAAALVAKRYKVSAVAGALTVVALVIGLLLARASLVDKLGDQTAAIPPGKSASDYVAVEAAFWLTTVLTALGAAMSFIVVAQSRTSTSTPPQPHRVVENTV